MDLLSTLLQKMEKPPATAIGEQQKKLLKKQQADLLKKQEDEKKKLKEFKEKVEQKIHSFIQDSSLKNVTMEPAPKVLRSIVHEVAEVAGLIAHSFGDEELEERHVVVYKKEFAPCAEELNAYRRGLPWDPEGEAEHTKQADATNSPSAVNHAATGHLPSAAKVQTPSPAIHTSKHERLLGRETAKNAVKVTTMNKQFGCVPSENKKDLRSIEQTLADIRAKKRQKRDDV